MQDSRAKPVSSAATITLDKGEYGKGFDLFPPNHTLPAIGSHPNQPPSPGYEHSPPPIHPSTGQQIEVAVIGRIAIARMFGKLSEAHFWDKHGAELAILGITFHVIGGRPRLRRIAAFPSMLMRWAAWKESRGENI